MNSTTVETKSTAFVLGTSDACSRDPSRDLVGPHLIARLKILNLFNDVRHTFVPNDFKSIKECIEKVLVEFKPVLLITIGGTGLRPRDVTPDVTSYMYKKQCTGIVAALHMMCLRYSPGAALNRLSAGIINDCLVINFPASEKACKDCMSCLEGFIEPALKQVRDQVGMRDRPFSPLRCNANNLNQVGQLRDSRPPSRNQNNLSVASRRSSIQSNASSSAARFIKREHQAQKPVQQKANIYTQQQAAKSRNVLGETLSKSPSQQIASSDQSNQIDLTKSKLHLTHFSHLDKSGSFPVLDYDLALSKLSDLATKIIELEQHSLRYDLTKRNHLTKILYHHILAEDLKFEMVSTKRMVSTSDGFLVNVPDGMTKVFKLIGSITVDLIGKRAQFETLCSNQGSEAKFYCCPIKKGELIPMGGQFVIVPNNQAELKPNERVSLNELDIGAHIEEMKNDEPAGDRLLKKGTIIGPVELGLLLSNGLEAVRVFSKPRIGLLAVEKYTSKPITTVNDISSTNLFLAATLGALHRYPVAQFGIVTYEQVKSKLLLSHRQCDIFVMTGDPGLIATLSSDQLDAQIIFSRIKLKSIGQNISLSIFKCDSRILPVFAMPNHAVSAYMVSLAVLLPFLERATRAFLEPNLMGLKTIGTEIKVIVLKLEDGDDEEGRYKCDADEPELLRAKIVAEPMDGAVYPVSISRKTQQNSFEALKNFDCLIPTTAGKQIELCERLIAYRVNKTL